MRFHFALVFCFLFAFEVLADRRREHRQSRLLNRAEQSPSAGSDEAVYYTQNWAGAVWTENNGTFTFITGTFTAPVLSRQSSYAAASAWIGIDGATCNSAGLLQAGIDCSVNDNVASCSAWYEWYPASSSYPGGIAISAGDEIRVNITTLSPTSGMVTIENLSNGQHWKEHVSSNYTLCEQNAEWIVEDFDDGNGNQVPLANFGTVTFTNALATGPHGTFTPDGATILGIQQNGKTLTSVSVNDSSLSISHV